jgi:hypothetical protein
MVRDGGIFAGERVDAVNPARWTSKYGSIVTSVFGVGTADGLNEKAVGMHLLYFIPAEFGARDPAMKGLQAALWGQSLQHRIPHRDGPDQSHLFLRVHHGPQCHLDRTAEVRPG